MLVRHGYPAAAYRQNSVQTASPGQLVVMLYRRAVVSVGQAVEAIERKDLEKANNELVRAQAILVELKSGLNQEAGEMAHGLEDLYDFFYRQLVDANWRKDPEPARQVGTLLASLLESWEAIVNQQGSSPQVVAGPASSLQPPLA